MKVIKDIRLFESTEENVDGYSPRAYGEKPLLIVLHRVVMKLREQSFTLGDFLRKNAPSFSSMTA